MIEKYDLAAGFHDTFDLIERQNRIWDGTEDQCRKCRIEFAFTKWKILSVGVH